MNEFGFTMNGWNGKILGINLTQRTTTVEEIAPDIYSQFVGGKGLGAYLLYQELQPRCDPLSPDNVLLFMTGPLQGLPTVMNGRWTLVTKSPLTGLFLDSHCGGSLGREIKNSGYDAISIVGKSESPVTILVENDVVSFHDAKHLWGKGTQESTRLLHETSPKESAVYVIGPAGENLVLTATGCCELAHQTGRGGVGAVLGSKNLKGIVVHGSRKASAANPETLSEVRKIMTKKWNDKVDYGFKDYGTATLVEVANERGQFPTRNWRNTYFEGYESLTPDQMKKWITGNHLSCPSCIIRCTHAYKTKDPSRAGIEVETTPEYETFGLCGGNLGISDAQTVFQLAYLADDLGLDTISAGAAIGFAMDAFETGIISEQEIGFSIKFGDGKAALRLMRMIAHNEGFGKVLGKGVRIAADEIGHGSQKLAVHVKGLETAAWDPRGKRGLGLSYATADVGSSHLRGWPQTTEKPDASASDVIESMVTERDTKIFTDSLVLCHFTWHFPLTRDEKIQLFNGATGLDYDDKRVSEFGQRVETLIRLFNINEGVTRADDILPPRFWEPDTIGPSKGMKSFIDMDDFERSLDKYYELRGWTLDGVPTEETIRKLGLSSIVFQD
ncbi:MAG: aldehyde ferredoxin oxidoreductase family protein [Candidatus Thorarchaeota archaeon]